jgi:two-component system, response regulator
VVLIVEDNPDFRGLMRDFVETFGATVREARDGYEAMAQVLRSPPHLIFCDLRMPGLDGRSLRKKLIAEHPDYQSRMIFVTGDLLGTAKAGTGIDGCPVVEKPFHSRAILSELARITG